MARAAEPAKKSAAKKSPADKPPAKRSGAPARKATAEQQPQRPAKQSASSVARAAVQQLRDLTGQPSEGVTAVQRTDDGWRVQVQVLELHRIPETTDVVALYDVEMDNDGDLQGYRRVRRYSRGESGEE